MTSDRSRVEDFAAGVVGDHVPGARMTSDRSGVEVDARPFPLEIDPMATAVIVVDMQEGFGGNDGWWGRSGVDLAGIQAAVAPTSRVLDLARRASIPVLYLTADLTHAGGFVSDRMTRYFSSVGTPPADDAARRSDPKDSEILAPLAPEPGEAVIVKPLHSGFYETSLDDALKALGVRTIIFTGCTTSICVESTLRDAYFRGYQCLLLSDCTAEPIGHDRTPSNYDATLLQVELVFGWVSDSESLADAFAHLASSTVAT